MTKKTLSASLIIQAKMRFLIPIFLCLSLTLYSGGTVAGQGLQHYINNYIGIQLDYPSTWMHGDSTQFAYVFFIPSNEYRPGVLPPLQDVSFSISKDWTVSEKNFTLDSYLLYTQNQTFKQSSFIQTEEPKKITLNNGISAYEVNSKSDKEMNKILLILTINNGTPYRIIYGAKFDKFDQYMPVIRSMISSLHFVS